MNLSDMVSKQVTLFQSSDASELEFTLAQANDTTDVQGRIALLNRAIEIQTRIVNRTYDYALDAHHPTPLYNFVKAVRTNIREQRNALQGKSSNARAVAIRAKFDSLLG